VLAGKVGGRAVALDELADALSWSDVVISCAAGSEGLITEELLGGRPDAALLIVDIALPRNVDRAVADRPEISVLDLDDVSAWAQRGREARAAEAARARDIVAEQLERFLLDSTARQAAPLVARLHDRAEAIRRREVDRFANRLDKLAAEDQETVAALTRAIVAKLLHEPSVRLRHDAGTPRGERNAAAVSDLFDLGPH
jgi:glutamyl-tRNA reductase